MATEYQITENQLAEFLEDLSQEDNTTVTLQDGQASILDSMTVEGGATDGTTASEPQTTSEESCLNPNGKNDLMLIMTPEKQDKTPELSKHWYSDPTPARNEVVMKTTHPVNQ